MADTRHATPERDADRFYTALHAAQEDSRRVAEQLLPAAERQADLHRQLVAELHGRLAREEAELGRWQTTVAQLRATVEGRDPQNAALGGRALAHVAVTVLADSGRPQPVHYRDWLDLVTRAGYQVAGADPQATFLTAIHRDKRCRPIGGRTGLWQLAPEEDT
jgi:hypothetical protein